MARMALGHLCPKTYLLTVAIIGTVLQDCMRQALQFLLCV